MKCSFLAKPSPYSIQPHGCAGSCSAQRGARSLLGMQSQQGLPLPGPSTSKSSISRSSDVFEVCPSLQDTSQEHICSLKSSQTCSCRRPNLFGSRAASRINGSVLLERAVQRWGNLKHLEVQFGNLSGLEVHQKHVMRWLEDWVGFTSEDRVQK